MSVSRPALLAARNAFIVLFVALFVLMIYQVIGHDRFPAASLWLLGAAVYYGSWVVYKRRLGEESKEPEAESAA